MHNGKQIFILEGSIVLSSDEFKKISDKIKDNTLLISIENEGDNSA